MIRANLPALRANVKALVTSVGSGVNSCVLYARLTPFGYWQRTLEGCYPLMEVEPSEPSSVSWPKWATAWDGACMELATLALRTGGKGSSLWRTPQAADADRGPCFADAPNRGEHSLTTQVKLWPTPVRQDSSGHGRITPDKPTATHHTGTSLVDAAGGSLNPDWVSRLMGFPDGWLDLGPTEVGKPESPE